MRSVERSYESSTLMPNRRTKFYLYGFLAGSVFLILWVTLLSRIGTESRHFYPLFWSLRAVLDGNQNAYVETIQNIILFIPFGVAIRLAGKKKLYGAITGAGLAIIAETCQWIFALGTVEIDDVVANGIGAYIGIITVDIIENRKHILSAKRQLITVLAIVAILSILGSVNVGKRLYYAHLYDREDGTRNLLVLNREPGHIGKSNMYVDYRDDGALSILGKSDIRAWKQISAFCLPAGRYVLAGFSGTQEKTIGIELEYYNIQTGDYVRLTPDIGPIEVTSFELDFTTRLRALIEIYPGAEGDYIAQPVIYREE